MAQDGIKLRRAGSWWSRLGSPHPDVPFRQWWWLPFAWLLFGALFSLQPLLWGGLPWAETVRFEALRWRPWLLLAPLVVWLSLRLPLVGSRWRRALLVHLLLGVVLSLGVGWLTQPTGPRGPWERRAGTFRRNDWRESGEVHPRPTPPASTSPTPAARPAPPRMLHPGWPFDPPAFAIWWMRLRITLPLYWSLVGVAHLLLFQIRHRRANRLEVQLAEARLASLQMQLQPHFLFNCLNAISSLVRKQPEVADEMICTLASLLRAALDTQRRRTIPLGEELKLARQYLRIQRVRFGDRLRINEEIDAVPLDVAVPPLLLQPLLENAVTHGLGNQAGTVVLRVFRRDGQLRLVVTDRPADPAATRPPTKPGQGIGLGNTRERLAALYGDQAGLTLQDDGPGLTSEVWLPLQPSTDARGDSGGLA